MSCPFFEPVSPLDWSAWSARLRPPLGAPYDGVCRAGAEAAHPSGQTLKDCCNMGYAAGRCSRFRGGEGEAVRFAVAPAQGAPGVLVRWLVESGGLPVRAGEVSAADLDAKASLDDAPASVLAQIRAYWASYRTASSD